MEKYTLSQVCEINPPKIIDLPEGSTISFIPMDSMSTDGHIALGKVIELSRVKNYSVFKNGDILFAKITPCMENGKGAVVNGLLNGYGAGSTEFIVLRPNNERVAAQWVYLFLSQTQFRLHCQQHMTGSAGQKRVPPKYLGLCEIPVPPLPEQHRIVARIEELFSQLDAGVETLKKTKAQLAVYRQAVLKEAFAFGTANKTVNIEEIVDDIRIGPFGTILHKSDYIADGIPVINPQYIKNNTIQPNKNVSISVEKAMELSAYTLRINDIIMGRRGEMGRTAPVTSKEEGWLCGTGSIVLRLKSDFDATFYAKILSSPDVVHYLEEHATGTTMKNLNENIVRRVPIPYITVEMQKKIMADIESKMSVCDRIEQTVDTALQQTEALRQSILKQAFEGRL